LIHLKETGNELALHYFNQARIDQGEG